MTQHQTPLAGVFIDPTQRESALQEAQRLPQIVLSPLSISDVELLGNGAYTPLTGFLNKADYESVVDTMHTTNGTVWSIPITLPVDREFANSIKDGQRVALTEPDGHTLAIVTVEEKFDYDKKREAREVFRTEEEKHPGVARLYQQGDVLLGGPVEVIDFPGNRPFMDYRHTPAETRALFAERGWKTVVGFQTRNPVHRSHEYLAKVAIEVCDGVLVHSLLGNLKPGDIPAEVRTRAIRLLIERYFAPNTVVQAGYPLDCLLYTSPSPRD